MFSWRNKYEGHGKAYTPRYNVLRTAQNCIISFSTMNVEHVESRFRYNEIRRFQLSFSDHVKSDKSSPRIQNLATVWQYQLYSISITSWIANATTWLGCPGSRYDMLNYQYVRNRGNRLRVTAGPWTLCNMPDWKASILSPEIQGTKHESVRQSNGRLHFLEGFDLEGGIVMRI